MRERDVVSEADAMGKHLSTRNLTESHYYLAIANDVEVNKFGAATPSYIRQS